MADCRMVAITSARPDGATSVAAATAAHVASGTRTLLIDLNLERPELAPLLDLPETQTIFHLAYGAQLAPVSAEDLDHVVAWHEGLAVLAGPAQAHEAAEIREHFIGSLLEAATHRFDRVVMDLGTVHSRLPIGDRDLPVLWVLSPTRLGLAAFERSWRRLQEEEAAWLGRTRVVLNQVGGHSLRGVTRFLERDYGVAVVGELPHVPAFWQQVELTRTLQALSLPIAEREAYRKVYGAEADAFRTAFTDLISRLGIASEQPVAAGGGA